MVMVHALFFGGHDDDGLVWRRAARGASLDLEERGERSFSLSSTSTRGTINTINLHT